MSGGSRSRMASKADTPSREEPAPRRWPAPPGGEAIRLWERWQGALGNQRFGQFLETVQRNPFPHGTNYRFDTYRVTESDLADPDIVARFEALTAQGLAVYRERVQDPAVVAYLDHLMALKSMFTMDRPEYLSLVQAAVKQMEDAGLAERTLSDVLAPLLSELAQPSRVVWRNEFGIEAGGKPFRFKPPGKGAKKINLRLVLDEADPKKEKRAGFFDSSAGQIVVVVRRNATVDSIRETLFHEGLHLAMEVLHGQGAAALGGTKDPAVHALEGGLNHPAEIEKLKDMLAVLQGSLNLSRQARNDPVLPDRLADGRERVVVASTELWEEILVRAETFYFELLRWLGSGDPGQPSPNYLGAEGLKDVYLTTFHMLTDADLKALTDEQKELIERMARFLLYRTRALIKARGVINLYVPHPLEPNGSGSGGD
jgi:hypothetical protein